ncbi:MAG: ribose 5-phosphate isomerase B [Syntrophobacterales bacterium]|nr:ribose 5-phosphate isomerase B [Syntrophobacterales bacterium]
MRIAVGSDHAGFGLKEFIRDYLKREGYEVEDVGTFSDESVHYPEFAFRVAKLVAEGKVDRGVLICGSGIGMCMAANRVRGVRAVHATEPYGAKMSRRHNDANVLCLGERFIGRDMALEILTVWLSEPFEGGRHELRVRMIDEMGDV